MYICICADFRDFGEASLSDQYIRLEELQARIPALPAPARLSRWQALKIVILGRA
jgi:hypothetical protein